MSEPAPLRCSFAAEQRGDPMRGTAAPALGFLLIEQPGPWGRFALTQSRLDPVVGRAVSAKGVVAGLRVLLIRRPGRDGRTAGRLRRFAVIDARPGLESAWWGDFGADAELLDVPLGRSERQSDTPASSGRPIYLVCTHGRHDACCAIRGRPVAAALAELSVEATWECSHVGGDRFAPNVVVLPQGLYYGRVEVADVGELVAAHQRGEVVPRLLRGRSRWLPAAQAAQEHARAAYGDRAIGALEPAGTLPLGDGRWQVRLRRDEVAGSAYVVMTVRATGHTEPGLLTCQARNAAHPPTFEVTEMTELPVSPNL